MKLSSLLSRAVLFAGVLALLNGCERNAPVAVQSGPSPEEKAAAEQQLQSKLQVVLTTADNALAAGQTNEALASVENAFQSYAFTSLRPQILNTLLQMMLRCDRIDAAQQRALAASTNPALATGATEVLYNFFHARGDIPNAQAWAATLADQPGVPHDVHLRTLTWDIADLIALRNDDQALAVLGKALPAQKSPSDSLSLLSFTVETLLTAGRPENVERVLTLAATLKSTPEIQHLVIASRVRASAASGDWAALTNHFLAAVNTLPDAELDKLLRTVTSVAVKGGKQTVMDQCDEQILFGAAATGKPVSLATAARNWGENAMTANKTAFPSRLAAMLRIKVQPDVVADLYTRFFYAFADQLPQLKEMIACGDLLAPLIADEDSRNEVRIKVLDGCFLSQDYDRALSLLAAGVPGANRNAQWHATATVKIKAHRALLRNEPREAVKYFREFMTLLRESKGADISDPVTGVFFPQEMVLGRNAKRIGDILAGIPDAAEAAKAYTEANDLYHVALKNTSDAAAIKVINDEIAQLPKSAQL